MADDKSKLTGLNSILALLHEDDESAPLDLPTVKAHMVGNYHIEIKSYRLEDGRIMACMKAYAKDGGIMPSREEILTDLIQITLHMFDQGE